MQPEVSWNCSSSQLPCVPARPPPNKNSDLFVQHTIAWMRPSFNLALRDTLQFWSIKKLAPTDFESLWEVNSCDESRQGQEGAKRGAGLRHRSRAKHYDEHRREDVGHNTSCAPYSCVRRPYIKYEYRRLWTGAQSDRSKEVHLSIHNSQDRTERPHDTKVYKRELIAQSRHKIQKHTPNIAVVYA